MLKSIYHSFQSGNISENKDLKRQVDIIISNDAPFFSNFLVGWLVQVGWFRRLLVGWLRWLVG